MIVLYKDHTVKRKDDVKPNKKELDNIAYLLIDTSSEPCEYSKNYIMIDPSRIPEFTSCKIIYQIILVTEYDGEIDEIPMPKVETTTSSLSDLFNLMNCIDRLNCVNEFIINDQWGESRVMIYMSYFSITLYRENKKFYEKDYYIPENALEKYSVGDITKEFRDIYNTNIIKKLYKRKKFLFLYKDMRWRIEKADLDYYLMGIPLLGSKTITLVTPKEFLSIMDIKKFAFTYSLQEADKAQREYIKSYIMKGLYDDLATVIDHDFILVSSGSYVSGEVYRFLLLDLLSHVNYSIRLTNFVYDHLYLTDDDDSIRINSVVSFVFYYRSNKKEKEIYINEDTSISLDKFLQLL